MKPYTYSVSQGEAPTYSATRLSSVRILRDRRSNRTPGVRTNTNAINTSLLLLRLPPRHNSGLGTIPAQSKLSTTRQTFRTDAAAVAAAAISSSSSSLGLLLWYLAENAQADTTHEPGIDDATVAEARSAEVDRILGGVDEGQPGLRVG